jgi:kynureninase
LTPVFSGWVGTDADGQTWDEVLDPARAARAYAVSNPDLVAQARFAAGVEEVAAVGVPAISAAVSAAAERVIALADEFAVPVSSPRNPAERAGIVVLEPLPEELTALTAALFNHGITATVRETNARISVHAGTTEETFDMVRAALVSYVSAV